MKFIMYFKLKTIFTNLIFTFSKNTQRRFVPYFCLLGGRLYAAPTFFHKKRSRDIRENSVLNHPQINYRLLPIQDTLILPLQREGTRKPYRIFRGIIITIIIIITTILLFFTPV